MDTGSKARTLVQKGPRLWIQVVNRALLVKKGSITLDTGTHLGFGEVEP
jgi:hypothetical protein